MATTVQRVKPVNPNAAVLIWNYNDRLNEDGSSDGTNDPNDIESVLRVSIDSVISISTSKSKNGPSGQFEIVLAPNKNWQTKITSGSWIVILMTQSDISLADLDPMNIADPAKLKWIGRIESVRTHVEVDQVTAARKTTYTINGKDWGCLFENVVYIDPVMRDNILKDSQLGATEAMSYENYLLHGPDGKTPLPTTTDNVRFIINLWGRIFAPYNTDSSVTTQPLLKTASSIVKLPQGLINYTRLVGNNGVNSTSAADLVCVESGVLTDVDNYEDVAESIGFIEPGSLVGMHSAWALFLDNCNDILNEVVCDLQIDHSGTGFSYLTLWKRIKPFSVRPAPSELDSLQSLVSKFQDINYYQIPIEDVLTINMGTNWRDRYNYAEVMFDQSLRPYDSMNTQIKADAQVYDQTSFNRDGFRPYIGATKYIACDPDNPVEPLPEVCQKWAYLLKEWYFNTHNMYNGALTIIGQDRYIEVGSNIMVDTHVISRSRNINSADLGYKQVGKSAYLLAHVESVSHHFTVNQDGARSFLTTIQFTRGIIVDQNRNLYDPDDDNATDELADSITNTDITNHESAVIRSGYFTKK